MPPFLLGDSHGHAGVGMARILGVCFALLFASSVGAVTIDVGPSDFRSFGSNGSHTGSGIRSTFTQQVRLPPTISGPTRVLPVSRNPIVPYASAAARMRPFTGVHPASVAASAAITGLFLAMEWYFDEDLGEWSVREIVDAPPDVQTGEWTQVGGFDSTADGLTWPSAQSACAALVGVHMGAQNPYWSNGYAIGLPNGQTACRGDYNWRPSNTNIGFIGTPSDVTCPVGYSYDHPGAICVGEESVPVIEGEFSRLAGELPNMSADSVAEGTGDGMRRFGISPGYSDTAMTGPTSVEGPETTSTSTDPVTGDTTVTTTSTTTNISYDSESITTSETTTSTTYQNGQETSTTVTTETPGELPVETGGGSSGDWPGFCDWAGVVCDWLNWTQEEPPPEQDLPAVVDDDFFEEKNISFGSKSCPEPFGINLSPFMDSQVSISFQPLCDFAGLIYYMVMAASYIIAAYITIGVARNA